MTRRGSRTQARANRHTSRRPDVRNAAEPDLSAILAERDNPFILILDGVQDPNNLGAVLRSADGAGVDLVIVPKDRAAGMTDTVRRVSVGAADHVNFLRVTNLARTLKELKEAGLWLVGTSDRGSKDLFEADLRGPLGLVMGSEETGLRRLTEESCDYLVRIPMCGTVECLNVSVATGVCLYEALRQRRLASVDS